MIICLICSGLKIGVVSEDVAPRCGAIAAIVFRHVLPLSSVCSDPIGDGGSGVVGLGVLSSVKALSSPSPSDERSRFSAKGLMSFSLLVSVTASRVVAEINRVMILSLYQSAVYNETKYRRLRLSCCNKLLTISQLPRSF